MMVVMEIISEVVLVPLPVAPRGCLSCILRVVIRVNKLWRYKEAGVVLPGSEAQLQCSAGSPTEAPNPGRCKVQVEREKKNRC